MKTQQLLGWILLVSGLAVAAPAQAPAEEELESQVVGVEMARGDGTFMGLAVEGNAFVLRFYDEEKQLVNPNVTRASAWWNPRNTPGRERTVLNLAGQALKSPSKVRPPLVFFVMLTLLDENNEGMGTYRFSLLDLPVPEEPPAPAPGMPRSY